MLADILTTAIVVNLLTAMVRISTPLLFGAIGELVTEHSGVMNLGLEGMLLSGAFVYYAGMVFTGSWVYSMALALLGGALWGLLLGILAIYLKVDQTVTGLSINLAAGGLTMYGTRLISARGTIEFTELLPPVDIPFLADIPYIGGIFFSHRLLTYIAFLGVPAIMWFLNRTNPGLSIRSAGENPRAVDTRGINVSSVRLWSTIFGGTMAALGGAFMTSSIASFFLPGMSNGRGWLVIIIVIAGNWRPLRIILFTLFVAFLEAVQLTLQGTGMDIPFQLLLALPYVFALIALVTSRVRSRMPAMLGVPYSKGG
jgi:general nucleoside transport system permease protein